MNKALFSVAICAALLLALIMRDPVEAESAVPWPVRSATLVSPADIDRIAEDPTEIVSLYADKADAFRAALGHPDWMEADEVDVMAAFSSMLAHAYRPYGASREVHFAGLLAEPVLDCDNYAILAYHFFETLAPAHTDRLTFVGWNGGAVGNHAQMLYASPTSNMLLDPTVGLVAIGVDFDTVARGIPVPREAITEMPARAGEQQRFKFMVRDAIVNGLYRPSDLLYYYRNIDGFITGGNYVALWNTPQADNIR